MLLAVLRGGGLSLPPCALTRATCPGHVRRMVSQLPLLRPSSASVSFSSSEIHLTEYVFHNAIHWKVFLVSSTMRYIGIILWSVVASEVLLTTMPHDWQHVLYMLFLVICRTPPYHFRSMPRPMYVGTKVILKPQ